jgi:hypothetical protein
MTARLRCARRLACAAAILLAAASCRTVPPDQVGQSAGAEQIAALDMFDARLLELRLTPDAAGLAAVRADLEGAAAQPGLNRRLRARVEALKAEAALMARDLSAARRSADSAAALSDAEEGVWIVRAALEPDPAARLSLMDAGVARADEKSRLRCERRTWMKASAGWTPASRPCTGRIETALSPSCRRPGTEGQAPSPISPDHSSPGSRFGE